MRLCRFDDGRLGVVDGAAVRDVTEALDVLPNYRYPLPAFDPLIANLSKVTARARAIQQDAPSLPLAGLKLLSPVANPRKMEFRIVSVDGAAPPPGEHCELAAAPVPEPCPTAVTCRAVIADAYPEVVTPLSAVPAPIMRIVVWSSVMLPVAPNCAATMESRL